MRKNGAKVIIMVRFFLLSKRVRTMTATATTQLRLRFQKHEKLGGQQTGLFLSH